MQSRSIYGQLATALQDNWRARARPNQLPPEGQWWAGWLATNGRGWGKTWVGSNFTNEMSLTVSRIALIGATAADVRDVMIEGPSGILQTAPSWNRPTYEPSKRKLEWPNGSIALTFSAEEPSRLRGPQFGFLWFDELCAAENAQSTWDMAMFGLRLGTRPRWLVTTTPRPTKLLRELLARENKDVAVVRGSTFENADNLAPSFLETVQNRYANTRLGRQELEGQLLLDIPGSLWTLETIERANGSWKMPGMKRVVVAIDPSGTRGEGDAGDSVGIIVAGLGTDGFGYVLADRTCKLSPDGWGRQAVSAYQEFKADRIVAERNFGGAMVEHVIRTVDKSVSYKEVTASRGKIARAEPVSALYEQSRVRHVGAFTALEDQMCAMTSEGYVGDGSPDRCDALVWALNELMVRGGHDEVPIVMPFIASQPRWWLGDSSPSQKPGGNPRVPEDIMEKFGPPRTLASGVLP